MNHRSAAPLFQYPQIHRLLLAIIICSCWSVASQAQDPAPAAENSKPEKLFASREALTLTLSAPWGDLVRDERNQDSYPATVEFSDAAGQAHAIPLTVERRGLTRQAVCKMPPIKLRFNKDSVKGTVFRGQTSVKLVTHCDNGSRWEQYYIAEMLAYYMYNLITERSFRVRPVNITYNDSERSSKQDPHFGFLIEDDGDVAKRNQLKKLTIQKLVPSQLDSLESSRLSLFQYLIGNPDWSALHGAGDEPCCHNAKLIGLDANSPLYAVPYDFDSAGLVNAHYAAPPAGLPIRQVTQRLYRGFCEHNATLETARQEYLVHEQAIYDVVNSETRLMGRNSKSALRFLGDFFDEIRDDGQFEKKIKGKCRK